jgi:hypothetical protein
MRFAAALLTATIVAFASGCGGDDSKKERATPEPGAAEQKSGEGEEAEREGARKGPQIPVADQTAFIQLAKGIGLVRLRAAPVIVGKHKRLASAGRLVGGRSQVARLKPRDARLRGLRDQLVGLMARFARARTSQSRRAARAAIRGADRIEAGLRAYSRQRPGIGGLIPD